MTSIAESLSHPDLVAIQKRLDEMTRYVREELRPRPADDLACKPSPEQWSVLECVDHLRRTSVLYEPPISAAIERSRLRKRESARSFRPSWLGGLFLKFLGPEARAVKAPRAFLPATSGLDPSIIDEFIASQEMVLALLATADGVDLNGYKLPSPVSWLIRFTIGDAFHVLVAHQERHRLQIERTLESCGSSPRRSG